MEQIPLVYKWMISVDEIKSIGDFGEDENITGWQIQIRKIENYNRELLASGTWIF